MGMTSFGSPLLPARESLRSGKSIYRTNRSFYGDVEYCKFKGVAEPIIESRFRDAGMRIPMLPDITRDIPRARRLRSKIDRRTFLMRPRLSCSVALAPRMMRTEVIEHENDDGSQEGEEEEEEKEERRGGGGRYKRLRRSLV